MGSGRDVAAFDVAAARVNVANAIMCATPIEPHLMEILTLTTRNIVAIEVQNVVAWAVVVQRGLKFMACGLHTGQHAARVEIAPTTFIPKVEPADEFVVLALYVVAVEVGAGAGVLAAPLAGQPSPAFRPWCTDALARCTHSRQVCSPWYTSGHSEEQPSSR